VGLTYGEKKSAEQGKAAIEEKGEFEGNRPAGESRLRVKTKCRSAETNPKVQNA